MYMRTPVSAVTSVWRSVSQGFDDPFFYYYRCTYIGRPVEINHITQKQLLNDNVFKELPIVRKNMQGINGVELLPSEYNHLLDISDADSKIYRFKVSTDDDAKEFSVEKDVEEKLIKPLLKKLDYSETDYLQQMKIMVGNHNYVLIPDFVLRPDITYGKESAFALIEAKFSIRNKKEFADTQIQARSYARQLHTKFSVIADKNNIWIMSEQDDYEEVILSFYWKDLDEPDNFNKLYKLIGKK